VSDAPQDLSYRALLRVPTLARVLLSMQIGRVAQLMVSIALVLFTLDRYGSPALAGLVTFASVFPGLAISPIAGALLDRHGRIRLVMLDFSWRWPRWCSSRCSPSPTSFPRRCSSRSRPSPSLTSMLSHTGLRSLFPILVPRPLWERVNAVDYATGGRLTGDLHRDRGDGGLDVDKLVDSSLSDRPAPSLRCPPRSGIPGIRRADVLDRLSGGWHRT